MAKTETKAAPEFQIEDFEKQTASNPYSKHVDALLNAGEGKSLVIRVATADVSKEKTKFQRAANDADRTARVVESVEDGEQTQLRFILKERETRPGSGPKGSAATVTDVPSE